MLKILAAPNDVLAQKSVPVKKVDKNIKKLIEEMKETLEKTTDPEGVGLAAPQIGKNIQLFVIKEAPDAPFYTFINPTLTVLKPAKPKKTKQKKDKDGVKLEGCLSLPNIWGTVERAPKVRISYLDENGIKHVDEEHSGFFATILQHEYDHLQGTLFPKHVLEQKGNLYKSKKDEKGEDIFEPLEI